MIISLVCVVSIFSHLSETALSGLPDTKRYPGGASFPYFSTLARNVEIVQPSGKRQVTEGGGLPASGFGQVRRTGTPGRKEERLWMDGGGFRGHGNRRQDSLSGFPEERNDDWDGFDVRGGQYIPGYAEKRNDDGGFLGLKALRGSILPMKYDPRSSELEKLNRKRQFRDGAGDPGDY